MWFEKYIKYKNKYLELKESLIGGIKIKDIQGNNLELSVDELQYLERQKITPVNNSFPANLHPVILNLLNFREKNTQTFNNIREPREPREPTKERIHIKNGGPGPGRPGGQDGPRSLMNINGEIEYGYKKEETEYKKEKKLDKEKINLRAVVPKIFSIKYNNLENITADELINLVGQRFGYLSESEEDAQKRFNFLLTYNNNDEEKAYSKYNEENDMVIEDYRKLKDLLEKLKGNTHTYLFNYESAPMEPIKGVDKSNVKVLNLGGFESREVIYKDFNHINSKITPQIDKIHKMYDFIDSCKNLKKKIDEDCGDFKIKIVDVQDVVFLRKTDEQGKTECDIGYTMEKLEGDTLQQMKLKQPEYFKGNKNLFKKALEKLIQKLTENRFLINDFHLDNVMWDYSTNTMTLIDITPTSFREENFVGELESNNMSVFYSIEQIII